MLDGATLNDHVIQLCVLLANLDESGEQNDHDDGSSEHVPTWHDIGVH